MSEFSTLWNTMLTAVFQSIPTIYYPLKNIIPELKDNTIHLLVVNTIQKEHFENKKREVLEYLNQHAPNIIEDIIVTADEKAETKKIIYTQEDKYQNFTEQNSNFQEFLQILNLKIID
jgi:hypothetical protein